MRVTFKHSVPTGQCKNYILYIYMMIRTVTVFATVHMVFKALSLQHVTSDWNCTCSRFFEDVVPLGQLNAQSHLG